MHQQPALPGLLPQYPDATHLLGAVPVGGFLGLHRGWIGMATLCGASDVKTRERRVVAWEWVTR
jgi:hypothetical protein